MPTSYAHYGPTHPLLGALAERVSHPLLTAYAARHGFHAPDSAYAHERGAAFAEKLRRGERIYLAGIGPAGRQLGRRPHRTVAPAGPEHHLQQRGRTLFGQEAQYQFPGHALRSLKTTMQRMGIAPERIAAWLATWDYAALAATVSRTILEELPASRACCARAIRR